MSDIQKSLGQSLTHARAKWIAIPFIRAFQAHNLKCHFWGFRELLFPACMLVFSLSWAGCVYRIYISIFADKEEVRHSKRISSNVGTYPWLLSSPSWLHVIMEMLKHIKKLNNYKIVIKYPPPRFSNCSCFSLFALSWTYPSSLLSIQVIF